MVPKLGLSGLRHVREALAQLVYLVDNESVHVTLFLIGVDVVKADHYSGLNGISELIIDSRPEHLH